MSKDDAFLKRLLATFKVEAAEHVARISSGLLELEKTRAADRRAELTEIVFREAHSLKGAARTVNNAPVETVCRSMENVFSVLKKQDVELASDLFDLLHRALDLLRDLLGTLDAEGKAPDKSLLRGVVSGLDNAALGLEAKAPGPGEGAEPVPEPAAPVVPAAGPERHMPLAPESVRVEKAKLDYLLLQAEGLLQAKQSVAERASELREMLAAFEAMEKRWTVARDDARIMGRFLKQGFAAGDASKMRASATRLLEFLESGRDSDEGAARPACLC